MKQLQILVILTIFSVVGLIFHSCIEDDFTTSSSDVLTFSRDTVNFDTVFTGVGTPTARLLVYNRAKKSVNISSIRFLNPTTNFRVNVDGLSGNSFQDIEIRAKDSIFVFIECTPPETATNEPYLLEDKLVFVTNGVTQEVQLEAYGQNVTRLKNQRITTNTTLTADRPYVVFDSLVVEKGAKLSIDPGTKLLFHDKASLVVHGTLDAVGGPGKMIDMRSDRLDNVLPNVAYDLLAGQWDGVKISADSYDNRMEYVNMRSTVYGLQVDSCTNLSRQKLTLVNSWLHNSQGNVLSSKYAKVDAYGCVFSEAPEAVVALTGGEHNFVQCTIANNYLFSAIVEPLLCLYHYLPVDADENPEPLMKASFDNCIVYGIGTDLNCGDLIGTQVYMRNVLLKSKGEDDENFINCLWDSDPLFYTIRNDYYFNYRLMPDSPAIGAGNPAYVTAICLYDMDGLDRLSAGAPALGAYVYVAPPAE